jgi:hypothetical protein
VGARCPSESEMLLWTRVYIYWRGMGRPRSARYR